MDHEHGDDTQDWVLPASAAPPTVAELVARIDEALATARASEAAVMTVGSAALDAAEQARRAADLAEQASATALAATDSSLARQPPPRIQTVSLAHSPRAAEADDDCLRDFSARADRVAARLRQLQAPAAAS